MGKKKTFLCSQLLYVFWGKGWWSLEQKRTEIKSEM